MAPDEVGSSGLPGLMASDTAGEQASWQDATRRSRIFHRRSHILLFMFVHVLFVFPWPQVFQKGSRELYIRYKSTSPGMTVTYIAPSSVPIICDMVNFCL